MEKDVRCHKLWIELDGVVPEFSDGDGFETLRALWEVTVALDPSAKVSQREDDENESIEG